MANRFRNARDIANRLVRTVFHERRDGNFAEVLALDPFDGADGVHVEVNSTDASAGVDISTAPGAAKFVYVTKVRVSCATAITVDLVEETSNTVLARWYATTTGLNQVYQPDKPIVTAVANKKLRLKTSGAGAVTVDVDYFIAA